MRSIIVIVLCFFGTLVLAQPSRVTSLKVLNEIDHTAVKNQAELEHAGVSPQYHW